MDYELVVIRGRSNSQTLKLSDGLTTLGRSEECNLRIRSSQVSRKHCELFEKNGRLIVKDLGSANGTYVNKEKVEGQRVLEHGDVLFLGKVKLRVVKAGMPLPARPGKKAADTAVAEAALGLDEEADAEAVAVDEEGEDEEFDIDIDEEPADPATATPTPPPAKGAKAPEKAKPGPKSKTPSPEEQLADDAVADFLMDLKIDDDKS
jgi:predicted component of type VI protein secretion system